MASSAPLRDGLRSTHPRLDEALALWARDYQVAPVDDDGDPTTEGWEIWQEQRQTREDVMRLFDIAPRDCSLGVMVWSNVFSPKVYLFDRWPGTSADAEIWFKPLEGSGQLAETARFSLRQDLPAFNPGDAAGRSGAIKAPSLAPDSLQWGLTQDIKKLPQEIKEPVSVYPSPLISCEATTLDSCAATLDPQSSASCLTDENFLALAQEPETHRKLVQFFGYAADRLPENGHGTGKEISCPFRFLTGHEDTTPSAQIFLDQKRKTLMFGCYRCGIYLTPGMLFYARTAGKLLGDHWKDKNLKGRDFALWTTRLYLHANVLECQEISLLPLPPGSGSLRIGHRGMEELMQIKWLWFRNPETLCSGRFGTTWFGLSEKASREVIKQLLALKIVEVSRYERRYGRSTPYLIPGKGI